MLRWLTDPSLANSIAGDLAEQRRRRANTSRLSATIWFCRSWLGVAVYLLGQRIGRGVQDLAGGLWRGGRGELRQSVRSLRRVPWYSLTAIGVVALSMALGTTVFVIVDGVLFRPLPVKNSNELYAASGSWLRESFQRVSVSAKDVRDWSAAVPELEFAAIGGATGGRLGEFSSRSLSAATVARSFFDVIGQRPLIGGFQASDFQSTDAVAPVLISYGVWQTFFGGRPDIVGQSFVFRNSTRSLRVAGVLPLEFLFPLSGQPDLLYPLVVTPADLESRGRRQYSLIVRVPPGVTLAHAQQSLDAAAQAIMADFPNDSRIANGAFDHVNLTPIESVLTRQTRPTFLLVCAAAGVLLLLACVNLAGLAAARAEDRWREMTLRRALGAGPLAIARTQLAETLLLASAGTAIGLLVTPALVTLTVRLLPASMSLLKLPAIDARVLIFIGLATIVVALVVAIWPAIVIAKTRLTQSIASRTTDRTGRIGRRLLVATQIAIGLMLTTGGTFVVGSLVLLRGEDPGYAVSDVIVIEASFSGDAAAKRLQIGGVIERLSALPSVRQVASFDGPFLRSSTRGDVPWKIPPGANRACLGGPKSGVSGAFFETLGFQPLVGRLPSPEEIDAGAPVAVVSQSAVASCWPGGNPIGQTFELADLSFTVVGVVRDVRFTSYDATGRGEVYVSNRIMPPFTTVFALRTVGAPDRHVPEVIEALRLAGLLPRVQRITTMSDALSDTIRPRRLNAWLFGAFASAALIIVAVGIFGLLAMTSARRTREFGVRCALGGSSGDIVRLLLGEQAIALTLGLVAGAGVSAWAVQFVKAYLYGFTPHDPRLWTISVLTIVVTALAGALVPAIRSSRIDPVRALRVD